MVESAEPIAFVRRGRPPTSNRNVGSRGAAFATDLHRLYRATGAPHLSGPLYGIVHHFVVGYDPHRDADAGAASKRVWDSLKGVAYDDDRDVVLRVSSRIDVGPAARSEVSQIDVTNAPSEALDELMSAIEEGKEQFLYIEVGPYRPSMVPFGLAIMEGWTG